MAQRSELTPSGATRVSPWRRRRGLLANAGAAALGWLLAGCTVGPDYVTPKPVMPTNFSEHIGSTTSAAQGSLTPGDAWWENLGDATLDSIIADALRSS